MSNISSLHARELAKSYGDRRVLDGVTLSASPGQRIGLVGENGVGKSTLLRLLADAEEPDSGDVTRPSDCGVLWQELPFPPGSTVQDVVDDALTEMRTAKVRLDGLGVQLEQRPGDADLLQEYGNLLEWAQDHDLWDADRRAELVLDGLGLSDVGMRRRLDELSGGQQSRLALAALLIRQPQALLLDEPTNHLDDEAVDFLERQLNRLPGTVVVASHDRVFLDEVCTDIVDLDPSRNGVTRYGGAYSDYLAAKRLEQERWKQQYLDEQDEIRQLRESVAVTARAVNHARAMKDNNKMSYDRHGGRVQRQISRRVRNAQNRLDELTRTQVRKPPEPLRFAATLTERPAQDELALSLHEVNLVGRLHVEQLEVPASARLMVTGPNGAGKSTLLKVLAGKLSPNTGVVHRAEGIRVGMLEQDVAFPGTECTPRELYDRAAGDASVALAELGLLSPLDLDRPVGRLSIGQRRRLGLAIIIASPPEVLLLDEPTNHLSLALAEELEDALRNAPGAVVVASHDRWLRRGWQGSELALADGKVV